MKTALLITTWNRTHLLKNTLERLFGTGKTLPDELIVVDDGGNDGCSAMLQQLGPFPIITKYIYTNHPGITICSHARNVGLKATDADVLIHSEPEVLFDTDVIAQMTEHYQRRQGLILPDAHSPEEVDGDGLEFANCFVSAGIVNHQQVDNSYTQTVNWSATWTALYKRQWLLDVGGWDESFPDPWGWDDVDLNTRLRVNGIGQDILHEVVITHQWHPNNQCNQERNEGHFRAKGFNDDRTDQLVANQGVEWGVVIP